MYILAEIGPRFKKRKFLFSHVLTGLYIQRGVVLCKTPYSAYFSKAAQLSTTIFDLESIIKHPSTCQAKEASLTMCWREMSFGSPYLHAIDARFQSLGARHPLDSISRTV